MSARITLWPREHGAYVELFVPLATSLLATGAHRAGLALAVSASLAFFATEPLRVLLGDRGARSRERAHTRAWPRLALLAAPASVAGALGFWGAPPEARWLCLALLPWLAGLAFAARLGTLQTAVGETASAVALAGVAAPVAVAGGLPLDDALVIWLGWSLAYAATVMVVNALLARPRSSGRAIGYAIAGGAACAALVTWIVVHPLAWFAAPLALAAVLVLIWVPRATHLRAVGLAFLAASVVAATCAVTTLHRSDDDRALEASFRAQMALHHHR